MTGQTKIPQMTDDKLGVLFEKHIALLTLHRIKKALIDNTTTGG